MEALFLKLVELSIGASWMVLAAVVLRLAFRNAPKWIPCALWALVALRLLCPVSIESAVSVVPDVQTVTQAVAPAVQTAAQHMQIASNTVPAAKSISLTKILSIVWLAGFLAMAAYAVVSTVVLRHRLSSAIRRSGDIRCSDRVDTPFVLGLFRPIIYLPFDLAEGDLPYIIAHEQAHIRRRDHWWKPLGFALLSVYWFNPVLWLAYILLCRDIEAACDERVIREMSVEGRRAYSGALLNCAAHRRVITACPVAFGEGRVKERIRAVMRYKKPAFWLILLAVLAAVVAAVCLLTTRKAPETPNVERPMLYLNGKYYIDPYMPESTLPNGYALAGKLDREQANHTGLAGTEYYVNKNADDFYTYQLCGTPVSLEEVDSEQRQMAYLRWIPADLDAISNRRLTMDAVKLLSARGDALTWEDFSQYVCEEGGYAYEALGNVPDIRCYPIDEVYELLVGGEGTQGKPQHIILRNRDVNAWMDIRTRDVEEFVAAYPQEETPPQPEDDDDGTKPPALVVTCAETGSQVTAKQGTYSWQYPDKGDMTVFVEADSPSPADIRQDLLAHNRLTALGTGERVDLRLRFGTPPDTVTARCCPEEQAETFEQFEANCVPAQCSADTLTLPQPGNWLWEVTAEWHSGECCGDAQYIFVSRQYITEVRQNEVPPSSRLVMLNGYLYAGTGEESTVSGRCGTMDGYIRSTVPADQTPTEHGQSNFGTDYSYQFLSPEELDVVIDGKWMVFHPTQAVHTEYVLQNPTPESLPPRLKLINGWFEFSISLFSSNYCVGSYTLTDDALTLHEYGGDTYFFDRDGETFVFRAEDSSPIPVFAYAQGADPLPPFGDGAVFAPEDASAAQ